MVWWLIIIALWQNHVACGVNRVIVASLQQLIISPRGQLHMKEADATTDFDLDEANPRKSKPGKQT
jgi:hypothetical protein